MSWKQQEPKSGSLEKAIAGSFVHSTMKELRYYPINCRKIEKTGLG
jgi:hypothetical protein